MIIGGFEPLSLCDFPGTPAAVIFTQGCNWRCRYCHNWSLLPQSGPNQLNMEDVLRLLIDRRTLLDGVVISGGEPTLQSDLIDFVYTLKDMGFRVKLDTNGSRPSTLETLVSRNLLDYVAMDIKAPWKKYGEIAGVEDVDIKSVQKSVTILSRGSVYHHFRTTYDRDRLSEKDIENIRRLLPTKSTHIIQKCR